MRLFDYSTIKDCIRYALAVLIVLAPTPALAAVGFDAKMSAGNQTTLEDANNATTISSTGMTVGGSATCLVGVLGLGSGGGTQPTGVSMTWNGVSMTAGPSAQQTAAGSTINVFIFYLVSPATGNRTLTASWTNTNDAYMSAISFTGTDTSTCINVSDSTSATSGTSLAVTTDASGATVVVSLEDGGSPTVNQTQIFSYAALDPGGGASYAIGGSGTNSHSFTGGGGTVRSLAGVHVIAGAGGAAGPHQLLLLGVGN